MSAPKGWRGRYQEHPAAKLLPMMPDPEIDELGEDIEKNGLQEPVVLSVDNTAEKGGNSRWQR